MIYWNCCLHCFSFSFKTWSDSGVFVFVVIAVIPVVDNIISSLVKILSAIVEIYFLVLLMTMMMLLFYPGNLPIKVRVSNRWNVAFVVIISVVVVLFAVVIVVVDSTNLTLVKFRLGTAKILMTLSLCGGGGVQKSHCHVKPKFGWVVVD